MEDKKAFIARLEAALATHSREGIEGITYFLNGVNEYLCINYTNGKRRELCVTGDSCVALMYDIGRALLW